MLPVSGPACHLGLPAYVCSLDRSRARFLPKYISKICPSTWVSILLNQERGAGVFHKDMADAVVDIAVINHPLNGGGAIVQAGTQATGIHLNFGIQPFSIFWDCIILSLHGERASMPQALGAT